MVNITFLVSFLTEHVKLDSLINHSRHGNWHSQKPFPLLFLECNCFVLQSLGVYGLPITFLGISLTLLCSLDYVTWSFLDLLPEGRQTRRS